MDYLRWPNKHSLFVSYPRYLFYHEFSRVWYIITSLVNCTVHTVNRQNPSRLRDLNLLRLFRQLLRDSSFSLDMSFFIEVINKEWDNVRTGDTCRGITKNVFVKQEGQSQIKKNTNLQSQLLHPYKIHGLPRWHFFNWETDQIPVLIICLNIGLLVR